MEYAIREHEDFVEVVTDGAADTSTFDSYLHELIGLDRWKAGTPFLNNHSGLNVSNLTIDDVREIADVVGRCRSELGRSRMAILANREVVFGMARMWEVFVDDKWDGETRVFRERTEAVDWLLKS